MVAASVDRSLNLKISLRRQDYAVPSTLFAQTAPLFLF